ncbi:MAG: flippase-like domain-containing protein [Planctomycetes bacterium]|nr:flippase-like domain-containing protein [Planctomycetota bacterium]
MKKSYVTLLKLLFVGGLMVVVYLGIDFQDRLVWTRGEQHEFVRDQVIEIQGRWDGDPVTYVTADDLQPRSAERGVQADGLELQVAPGFLTYWRNLDPWLFALGAACYALTMLISGTRWWWLLRVNGTDVSLLETLRFTWIGVFFNTVIPGQTGGDLIKALYIMKRCPGHRVQVMVSVAVDRLLGLASLALLGAVVVLFALDRFAEVAIGIWGVIGTVGLMGVFAFSKRLRERIRLKALLEKLPPKVSHLLKLVDQAVFFYRNHKGVIVGSLLAGVVNHLTGILSIYLVGEALGVGLPAFEYFALLPVINIVSALPLGPNGWGVGELMYKTLFGKYGAAYLTSIGDPAQATQVMGTRGVALSVLYRLHLTFWGLLGGLLVLFEKDRVTKADIVREVEREEEEDRQAPMDPPAPHG